ncbi:MAG TPA: hypothetical protein VFL57_13805 [Bryobacteraceae bacterium]|nr:hypothetical protein [Bryobacteraceae bacterium]
MPSERQLKANRRNAALGGPKTDEGRAAVRFNALQHGLAAATAVLPGEDAAGFKQLREDLVAEYRPATPTDCLLVEEFAICSWRLLRLRRVEAEMWSGYILSLRTRQGVSREITQQESDRALAATLAETSHTHMANFFRYERTTTRDFYRALDKLEAMQRNRRRGERLAGSSLAAPTDPDLSGNGIRTDLHRPEPAGAPGSTQSKSWESEPSGAPLQVQGDLLPALEPRPGDSQQT